MYDYSNVPEEMSPLYRLIVEGIVPFLLIGLPIVIFYLVTWWKIYKKAGKPGWTSLVPIYNFIVMIEITGLPIWYIALMFIPIVNIYAMFKIYIELAHKFGKSTVFGVAMVFFPAICFPILAFSKKAIYNDGNNMNQVNNLYQPQMNYENQNTNNPEPVQIAQPEMTNTQMANENVMVQNVATNPVETPVQPQTPVENIMPVQPEPVINQEPVFVEQPVVNNTQMSAVNSIQQSVTATPVETQVAPQMPVENITPVQPEPVINQEPVFVEQPVVNNTQMSAVNSMQQPVTATPAETQVAPQMPVENITLVQPQPVINQEPVFVEQPVVNNNQNGGLM